MRLSILLLTFVVLMLSSCEQSMLDQSSTNNVNSPASSTDYRAVARQDAIDAGIRDDYFVAQINQESGFRPDAVSYAGAIGIAQIMKSTAQSWNVDPWDPIASLKVASEHMAWYQNTYGSYEKALACYNAGCSSLLYAESHCIDFYWCLPAQTRGYITNITGYV
jgi:soluble lytic murein transglycosylase-like protein